MNFSKAITLVFLNLILCQVDTKNREISARIVGGDEVNPPFKYWYMVSLQFFQTHYCGGTLLRDDLIITAAHCSVFPEWQVQAVLHRHDLNKTNQIENGRTYQVLKIIKHPNFNKVTYENDIAIWKINSYSKIYRIYLDSGYYGKSTNIYYLTMGWGATMEGGDGTNILRQAYVPSYNMNTCISSFKALNSTVNPQLQLCAGYQQGGIDACRGDSGGPLMTYYNSYPVLTGIVSFGSGCARKDLPGIYTRVSAFTNWVFNYANYL